MTAVLGLLQRFRYWLHYLHGRIRHGLARLREQNYRFWRTRAARLVAAPAFVACLFGGIELAFSQLQMVYVSDSAGGSVMLLTQETVPAELLEDSGLELGQYDECYYTSYGGSHAVLTVQRAYEVEVQVDGQTKTAWLNGGTVADALTQLGVRLSEEDFVEPSLHTPLAAGEQAIVHRVTYTDTIEETVVPFETEYRYTSLLHRYPSRTYVLQEGADGTMATVFRERRVDGEVVSSQQIDQYMTLEPVNQQVLAYGAGAPVSTLSAPEGYTVTDNVPSSYRYLISNAICTGYSASRGRGASGLGLYAGTVAVNPEVIPYGSLLYITSADGSFVYGWAIATDTGTALMEGIIDIDLFYSTHLESSLNGKKALNVYVIS